MEGPVTQSAGGHRYLPEIDGLRAVAVVAVMIYHMHASWLPGGYTGVDVFFAISGYVISNSISDAGGIGVVSYLLRFYARRVLRILPALLVCLLATNMLVALFVPSSWLSNSAWLVLKFAFFGLSNIALLRTQDSYFGPRAEYNAFTHTWSLGVEEQFYVVFPMLFYLYLVSRNARNETRRLTAVLLPLICIASLIFCAYQTSHALPNAYYTIAPRFWELVAGALLFQFHLARPQWSRALSARVRGAEIVVSLLLLVVAFGLSLPSRFPFPLALAPILGTIGLIDALVADSSRALALTTPFRSRVAVWIGARSYSLYLWHWPVYVLLRWTIGLESWPARIAALVATVFLSIASFRWIESPFRRLRVSTDGKRALLIATAGAIVLGAFRVAQVVVDQQPALSLSITARDRSYWYPDAFTLGDYGARSRCTEAREVREFEGGSVVIIHPAGCVAGARLSRVFVIGNSHAPAYLPLLQRLAGSGKYEARLYYRPTCAFLWLWHPMKDDPVECLRFHADMIKDVLAVATAGDVVFLPSFRLPRFTDQWRVLPEAAAREQIFSDTATAARMPAVREAPGILRPLLDAGLQIVIEGPKPIFRSPPFRCSDWFNSANPICAGGFDVPRDELQKFRQPMLDAMQSLARADSRITVWDPFYILCPEPTCHALANGKSLYFDGDHLSAYASEVLYPSFDGYLREITNRAAERETGKATEPKH